MGAKMTIDEKVQLILTANVWLLIGVEIASTLLFVKLTQLLNAIESTPVRTVDEALKQRNTYTLFKTNALLTHEQANRMIQLPLRQMNNHKQMNEKRIQLIKSVLKDKKLSQQQIKLYLRLDYRLRHEASFNRFAIVRALFHNSNIPLMYPSRKNHNSFQHSTSLLLSQNMLTLAKINGKGEMTSFYLGFNRQFIMKIFTIQRRIVFIEFLFALGLLMVHPQQIENCYNWFRRSIKNLFKRIRNTSSQYGKQETCIICYVAPRNLVFRECKHFILCSDCAYSHTDKVVNCPICRKYKPGEQIKVRFE